MPPDPAAPDGAPGALSGGRSRVLLVALAVVLVVGGLAVALSQRVPAGDRGSDVVPAASSPAESADPAPEAEAPPGAPAPAATGGVPESQTTIEVPTQLVLPDGTAVPVDPAGVDAVGALTVPVDPARAGWWTGGAQVGEPFGSVVIAGHVDSRQYGVGAMARLESVVVGDLVTAGDGTTSATYQVTSVEQQPKADISADSPLFDQRSPHRLVLITCGGEFDRTTHHYADNLVVIAVPVA